MAHFTSNFQRLKPLLQRVVFSGNLTAEDQEVLTSFQNSPAYDKLPKSAEVADSANKTGLFLLKQAADSLSLFAKGDNEQALQAAKATQNLKLGLDPFKGFF